MSAGDLSLSQSLGGLRIANPDDEDALQSPSPEATCSPPPGPGTTTSATSRPPPPSSRSSNSTVTPTHRSNSSLLPQLTHDQEQDKSGGLGWNPDSYTFAEGQGVGESPSSTRERGTSQSSTPPRGEPTSAYGQRSVYGSGVPSGYQAQQAMQYPSHSSSYSQQLRAPVLQTPSIRPSSGLYNQSNASGSSGISSHSSYNNRQDPNSSDGSIGNGLARNGSQGAMQVLGQVPSRESSRSYRSGSQQLNGGNGPLPPRRNSRRSKAPAGASSQSSGPAMQDPGYNTPTSISRTREEWQDPGVAAPRQESADPANGQTSTRVMKKGVKDFNFGRTLGEGSYSTVLAATDRQTLKEYAIKVLDKRHIIKEKKVKYVNIERDTLNRLTDHPGIVRLYYTFQDERSLYFVLDLASGGELLGVLKKLGSFDMECARFYSAEILDSISYMHSRGVIHRDLKPENVLLDRDMHVKITDFGTAKILGADAKSGATSTGGPGNPMDGSEQDRAVSFVGTAEYVSPELLRDKNACKSSDLWAFGCIVYQLLAGRPPFKAANEYLTFQKILALDYSFPDGFPDVARDLVERLLVLEPANRMPIEYVMAHPFFEGIQWGKGLWRLKVPRLKPYTPPAKEPIRLNGHQSKPSTSAFGNSSSAPTTPGPHVQAAQAAAAALAQTPQRPQLRGVTELPPPSQLDIEWSPVLTHNNERILKLGNLIVTSAPQAYSPNSKSGEVGGNDSKEKPKFSRFFSGGHTTKKRERLVLITSAARIIIAAAGGTEKKAKMELRLLSDGCTWNSFTDSRGLVGWQADTKDKHLIFEDPRATTSDPAGSKFCTQEWLDSLDNACELAQLQHSIQSSQSFSPSLNEFTSNMSSPSDSIGGDGLGEMPGGHHLRQTLRKANDDDMNAGSKGRKRFSKRHSKSGLAAVF